MDSPESVQMPLLQIVRGNPTREELAALTAVVLSLNPEQRSGASARHHRSWSRRRQLALQPTPGPGAWRRSGR